LGRRSCLEPGGKGGVSVFEKRREGGNKKKKKKKKERPTPGGLVWGSVICNTRKRSNAGHIPFRKKSGVVVVSRRPKDVSTLEFLVFKKSAAQCEEALEHFRLILAGKKRGTGTECSQGGEVRGVDLLVYYLMGRRWSYLCVFGGKRGRDRSGALGGKERGRTDRGLLVCNGFTFQ